MPDGFMNCVKNGGKVVTKTLKGGKYVRLCKKGGKWYTGEVRAKGDVATALKEWKRGK